MAIWSQYKLLIIGIILMIASAFVLAQLNLRESECQSATGQIIQLFDMAKKESCAQLVYLKFLAYAGIALGIALVVIQFVRKE